MRDVSCIQSCNRTLSHIVVLSVDYVELFAGADYGLNDLLCILCVPLSGLLLNNVPVSFCICLSLKSAAAAFLCCGTHHALKVDDVVGLKTLICQPVNSGLALFVHIGYDRCKIEALVCVDSTVKQDNLNACVLSICQHGIPA